MKEEKLTQIQKAKIHCVKHGHAKYVYSCWGYVQCGRCGDQIGDRLAGVFPMDETLSIHCKIKICKTCKKVRKELSGLDKKILSRLEKAESIDHDKILKGIRFD